MACTPSKDKRVDVYLAEHKALRDEELIDIRLRQYIRIAVWTISGAIYGFVFSNNNTGLKDESLLIIPIVTFILSIFWAETQLRIESFHVYIRDEIAPKVREIFNEDKLPANSNGTLLGWEGSTICSEQRKIRKFLRYLFDITTFILVPALAIYLFGYYYNNDNKINDKYQILAWVENLLILFSGVLMIIVEHIRSLKSEERIIATIKKDFLNILHKFFNRKDK